MTDKDKREINLWDRGAENLAEQGPFNIGSAAALQRQTVRVPRFRFSDSAIQSTGNAVPEPALVLRSATCAQSRRGAAIMGIVFENAPVLPRDPVSLGAGEPAPVKEPGLLETVGAAFRAVNPVVSLYNWSQQQSFPADPSTTRSMSSAARNTSRAMPATS
ncbi:MAG: hypothetical protein IPK23_15160 [Rhizobiales bacterium]|nr:hypothetical protein [Hyphomicrobiales bacterium]